MIRLDKHQWRLYVLNRRLHHGLTGVFLIALGMVLALHDKADFPWALSRDQ